MLRSLQEDDDPVRHRVLYADPEVMRYLPGGTPLPFEALEGRVRESLDHWSAHGYGVWAVTVDQDGTFAGQCGLRFLPEFGETEVLYSLGVNWWGAGVATEAARASVRFGFEHVGLDQIIGLAVQENEASRRVLVKCGLHEDGEVDEWGLHLVRYRIDRDGWEPSDEPYEVV